MSEAGRPQVMTPEVVALLVSAFRDGLNITQACWQAGISRESYYHHINSDPELSDKMDRAQQFLSMNSRQNISKAVQSGDLNTSKWLLERKNKDEFSTRQELTGKGGKPLATAVLSPEEQAEIDGTLTAKPDGAEAPNETSETTDTGDGRSESESVS
jgi:hypothetical protein